MKKRLLLILILVLVGVPLLMGGAIYYMYKSTDAETAVPEVSMVANGVLVSPAGYTWHYPIFGGMVYKEFEEKTTMEAEDAGEIEGSQVVAIFPEGYTSRVCIYLDNEKLWDGGEAEFSSYVFTQSGRYVVQVESEKAEQSRKSWGSITFRFALTVDLEPALDVSASNVRQGDVLAIRVTNVADDMRPTAASSAISPITFTDSGGGSMTAFVPITHDREPGEYTVSVAAGWYSWDVTFRVTETDFGIQELEIDTSDPVISEANSPAAYQQYRDEIYPIFAMIDEHRYWDGMFAYPVDEDSRISTNYGLARYTNGALSSRPHNGMDFAVPEGTEVSAPNHGTVVFSEYLLNTGNTIVIEHGGGLKTYYFHLSERNVETGDMVSKGQTIGLVGTTGYSTGPHLHYEVRIGDQSIDPAMMFEKSSGFYAFMEDE